MRILADLPDDDIAWLDAYAGERGMSRASVIRDAISTHRAKQKDWLEQGFGLWTRFGQGADGAEYEAEIRKAWDTGDNGDGA